jgi:hypothetical protein
MNQWRKGIASWRVGDTLYQSIPFTWLLSQAENQAREHKGAVIAGGPAVSLMGAPWAETPEAVPYDTLSFHNPLATFTTRGCPNRCEFCAVPKIEGDFDQLHTWKPAPIVCDNNLLAGTQGHFYAVIESLRPFPYADFNQGLEARRLKPFHVDLLRSLKAVKIRFAFDHWSQETAVHDAIELCQKAGLNNLGCYCLIGWNDDPQSARARLDLVRSWGIRPNAMRYQPLDTLVKNSHIGEEWTKAELLKTMHYYNHLRWYEHIPFDDFNRTDYTDNQSNLIFCEAV